MLTFAKRFLGIILSAIKSKTIDHRHDLTIILKKQYGVGTWLWPGFSYLHGVLAPDTIGLRLFLCAESAAVEERVGSFAPGASRLVRSAGRDCFLEQTQAILRSDCTGEGDILDVAQLGAYPACIANGL